MMKITGQAKIKFEEWLKTQEWMHQPEYSYFVNKLPDCMKYGVYVTFFDSVGINITLEQLNFQQWYSYKINHAFDVKTYKGTLLTTRPEARTKAINKANEIYNGNTDTTLQS